MISSSHAQELSLPFLRNSNNNNNNPENSNPSNSQNIVLENSSTSYSQSSDSTTPKANSIDNVEITDLSNIGPGLRQLTTKRKNLNLSTSTSFLSTMPRAENGNKLKDNDEAENEDNRTQRRQKSPTMKRSRSATDTNRQKPKFPCSLLTRSAFSSFHLPSATSASSISAWPLPEHSRRKLSKMGHRRNKSESIKHSEDPETSRSSSVSLKLELPPPSTFVDLRLPRLSPYFPAASTATTPGELSGKRVKSYFDFQNADESSRPMHPIFEHESRTNLHAPFVSTFKNVGSHLNLAAGSSSQQAAARASSRESSLSRSSSLLNLSNEFGAYRRRKLARSTSRSGFFNERQSRKKSYTSLRSPVINSKPQLTSNHASYYGSLDGIGFTPLDQSQSSIPKTTTPDPNEEVATAIEQRRFYDDFTTTDWVRDTIHLSSRRKYLASLRGIRGRLIRMWDASQGWILTSIVSFMFAFIVYCFDKAEEYLFELKNGVCTKNVLWGKQRCCLESTPTLLANDSLNSTNADIWKAHVCSEYVSWEKLLTDENTFIGKIISRIFYGSQEGTEQGPAETRERVEFIAYLLFTVLFALIAATITLHSKTSTFVTTNSSQQQSSSSHSPDIAQKPDEDGQDYPHETTQLIPGSNTRHSSTTNASESVPSPQARVIYSAYGSGVPEVKTILSGFVIREYLGTRALIYKASGLVFSLASGLCVGKEGPFVHLATCVGNIATRLFPKYSQNNLKRRQILAAASSAGVALAFGSPIGGVLFALEEVTYYFLPHQLFRIFLCALMSAMFLVFIFNPYNRGTIVFFEVAYDKDAKWRAWELVCFVSLGIFGGIYGGLFCKFAGRWWPDNFRKISFVKKYPRLEVLFVAIITGYLSFSNHFTRSAISELLLALTSPCKKPEASVYLTSFLVPMNPDTYTSSFSNQTIAGGTFDSGSFSAVSLLNTTLVGAMGVGLGSTGKYMWAWSIENSSKLCPTSFDSLPSVIYQLLYALVVKIALTSVSFGMKVPAGIYVPSMVIGALFGRIFGILVQYLGHAWSPQIVKIFHTFHLFQDTFSSGPIHGQETVKTIVNSVVPGAYAMAGAGAFMAGVTRMSLTLVVILFELTGTLNYVMPFSVSILVANLVANMVEKQSLYEILIERNNFPFLDNRITLSFDSSLADICEQDSTKKGPVIDISAGSYVTAGSLNKVLHELHMYGEIDGCIPIVKHETLFGVLPAPELEFALDKIKAHVSMEYFQQREEEEDAELAQTQMVNDELVELFENVLCKISVKDTDIAKYHRYYYASDMAFNNNNNDDVEADEEEGIDRLITEEGISGDSEDSDEDEYGNDSVIFEVDEILHDDDDDDNSDNERNERTRTRIRGMKINTFLKRRNNRSSNINNSSSVATTPRHRRTFFLTPDASPGLGVEHPTTTTTSEVPSLSLPSGPLPPDNDNNNNVTVCDLTPYIDRAPIFLDIHSPMALVQMVFTKLGVRAIAVTRNENRGRHGHGGGVFVCMVHKKQFVEYCHLRS